VIRAYIGVLCLAASVLLLLVARAASSKRIRRGHEERIRRRYLG
jgi:hypothetical protein